MAAHFLIVTLRDARRPLRSPDVSEEEANRQLALIAEAQRDHDVVELPWATFRGPDVIVAQKYGEERDAA
jgi:hypothetical protein